MGRRFKSSLRPIKYDVIDYGRLFLLAAQSTARGAGLLDAYRRGSGLLFRPVNTGEAQASLAAAVEECARRGAEYGRSQTIEVSMAGGLALSSYLPGWWTTQATNQAPHPMEPGDEWFSRESVARIVEDFAEAIPDKRGPISEERGP